MPYSNVTDAITKLKSATTDNASFKLYLNNTLLDSTTIFYQNEARTILAPAGNYVLPTNYRSIYVTIGNDGKIIGNPVAIAPNLNDVSWAESSIWKGNTKTSSELANFVLDTNLNLTDTFIYEVLDYKWCIDNGPTFAGKINNLNLSDMKGFDLTFYYGRTQSTYFMPGLYAQFAVHIAADPNRQTIFDNGKKIYYFGLDYFVGNPNQDAPNFFRRLPDITLKDRYGKTKMLVDMNNYIHDIKYPTTGNNRISTRFNKGLTNTYRYELNRTSAPTQYNVTENLTYAKRVGFGFDQTGFQQAFLFAHGRAFNLSNYDKGLMYGLLCSMNDVNFSNTTVVTVGGQAITYKMANPYEWTTIVGSGITYNGVNGAGQGPANIFTQFYRDPNVYADLHWWNLEWIAGYTSNQPKVGDCFNKLVTNARAWTLANDPSNFYDTKHFLYGQELTNIGAGMLSWYYAGINSSNVLSSGAYLDYKNYVADSTTIWQNIINTTWTNFADNLHAFAASGYLITISKDAQAYFYAYVHTFDICKKLIFERYGTNTNKRINGELQKELETILSGGVPVGDASFLRRGRYANDDYYIHKPDHGASLYWNVGVWMMGYGDGMLWFNFQFNALEDRPVYTTYQEGDQYNFINRAQSDWQFKAMFVMYQNRDILEAATNWKWASVKKSNNTFTIGSENVPVFLWANQLPLVKYKLNVAETEAVVLVGNFFNNGYTKASIEVRIYNSSLQYFDTTIDTWGLYTSVVRLKDIAWQGGAV